MEDSLKDKFPHLPERLVGLGELASNLWWSWHPEARNLFRMLDLLAWRETGHNPVKLLEALPAITLEIAACEQKYPPLLPGPGAVSPGFGKPGLLVHGQHHRHGVRTHRLLFPGVR